MTKKKTQQQSIDEVELRNAKKRNYIAFCKYWNGGKPCEVSPFYNDVKEEADKELLAHPEDYIIEEAPTDLDDGISLEEALKLLKKDLKVKS